MNPDWGVRVANSWGHLKIRHSSYVYTTIRGVGSTPLEEIDTFPWCLKLNEGVILHSNMTWVVIDTSERC